MYSKLGVNCAHSSFFTNPVLQEIKNLGFTRVRMLQSNYASVAANIRTTAASARSLGLYVVYGMQAPLDGTFTSTSWTAYKAAVVAEATYAQANNLCNEFQIGNEMENAKDGTITNQQVYDNMIDLAAQVRAVYTGKISYSFSATNAGVWNTNAASLMANSNFDFLGANIYGGWSAPGTFASLYNTHVTNFSTKAECTEFNIDSNWSLVPTDADWQAVALANRMQTITSAGIPAYFFEWNHGSNTWAIKLTDGTYRVLLNSLQGGRRNLTL